MTEIDVKYARDKNLPAFIESIAAELVVRKPADPEQYLREKFAEAADEQFKASDPPLTLYVQTLCPLSAVALIAAHYTKRCFPTCALQTVEVAASEARAGSGPPLPSEFTALSPFTRVPALDHNGLGIAEVGAVVRYLCARTPAFPSASSSLRARAKVEALFDAIQNLILVEAVTAVAEKVFLPRRSQRPVDNISVQAAATRFRSALSTLQSSSGWMTESHWLIGTQPSIADFALAGAVYCMHHVAGYDCVTGFEKIGKWWQAVQQEPYVIQSMASFVETASKLR